MTAKPDPTGHPGATADLVARIIVSTLIGGVFVAASAYAMREFVGTPWLHEAVRNWRAGEPVDSFGIVLFGAFQIAGVLTLFSAAVLILTALRRLLRADVERERRAAIAAAPWTVRKDWAQGRVEETRERVGASIVVALFLIALTLTIALWITKLVVETDIERGVLLVWIFPAAAILMTVPRIVKQLARRLRFKRTVFELDTVPGAIGGYLAGRPPQHSTTPSVRMPHVAEASLSSQPSRSRAVVTAAPQQQGGRVLEVLRAVVEREAL